MCGKTCLQPQKSRKKTDFVYKTGVGTVIALYIYVRKHNNNELIKNIIFLKKGEKSK